MRDSTKDERDAGGANRVTVEAVQTTQPFFAQRGFCRLRDIGLSQLDSLPTLPDNFWTCGTMLSPG